VLYLLRASRPFALIDSTAEEQARIAAPWNGYASLHFGARQGFLASDPSTGRWVFAFVFGDGWFAFRQTTPMSFRGQYAEHTDFPDVFVDSTRDRQSAYLGPSTEAARSIALHDSVLSVLFTGVSPLRGRVIDRFSVTTGEDLGSLLLPASASAIAVDGNRYVVLVRRPTTRLLILTPHVR
jgi:hypothetical protein